MTVKALIITGQESETTSTLARNLIQVGGLSLLERQLKLLSELGIEHLHLVTDWFVGEFEKTILDSAVKPEHVHIHRSTEAAAKISEASEQDTQWLILEEGVLLDKRIIQQLLKNDHSDCLAFSAEDAKNSGLALPVTIAQTEQSGHFASVAKLSAQTVAQYGEDLIQLDKLKDTLQNIANLDTTAFLNIQDIPLYKPTYQRDVPLLWYPICRQADEHSATTVLLDHVQIGGLDWPATLIHRPVENLISRYVCRLPVERIMISALNVLLGLGVIYLFAAGQMIVALIGALCFGLIVGIKDKITRLKRQKNKIPELEHICDSVIEYGWYLALAIHLSVIGGPISIVFAILLILFQLADTSQNEFFRRMSGQRLSAMASFDQKFHLIAARRNTLIWALIPFAILSAWTNGLMFLGIYAVITFFIRQARIMYHMKNLMEAASDEFVKNFRKTKIFKKAE